MIKKCTQPLLLFTQHKGFYDIKLTKKPQKSLMGNSTHLFNLGVNSFRHSLC